jgi:hypothetical protein
MFSVILLLGKSAPEDKETQVVQDGCRGYKYQNITMQLSLSALHIGQRNDALALSHLMFSPIFSCSDFTQNMGGECWGKFDSALELDFCFWNN